MKIGSRGALLLVGALLAALVTVGLGSASGFAPQAAACEKHEKKDKKDCQHAPRPSMPSKSNITAIGTLTESGLTVGLNASRAGGRGAGTVTINGDSAAVRELFAPEDPVSYTGPHDYYCVNFVDAGGSPTNLYFQDIGNGLLTHDTFEVLSSTDTTSCADSAPGSELFPSTAGDIVVTRT